MARSLRASHRIVLYRFELPCSKQEEQQQQQPGTSAKTQTSILFIAHSVPLMPIQGDTHTHTYLLLAHAVCVCVWCLFIQMVYFFQVFTPSAQLKVQFRVQYDPDGVE